MFMNRTVYLVGGEIYAAECKKKPVVLKHFMAVVSLTVLYQ